MKGRPSLQVVVGVLLLCGAVACLVAIRGVRVADREFAARQVAWQRGLVATDAQPPAVDVRVGERLLGVAARADVQRAYERYRAGLADVIEGTVYPQTQARFRAVAELTRLRGSLDAVDRAAVDVAAGVILVEGAKTAGEQRGIQLDRAADAFRRALQADAGNETAKFDLEILLRQVEKPQQSAPRGQPSGSAGKSKQQDPKGPPAATRVEGSGF